MKVLILESDDWNGLYINGNLIDEGHTLGEGDSILYLLEKSEDYGFDSSDVKVKFIEDVDDEYLNKFGSFPSDITELKGDY